MEYQNSSNKTWYIIGSIVLVALAFWYFSMKSPPTSTGPATAEQTQQTPPDTTTAAISSDLNQIPDDTAALNQAANTSAAAVKGF